LVIHDIMIGNVGMSLFQNVQYILSYKEKCVSMSIHMVWRNMGWIEILVH
jgi:hypothetical protein